MKDIHLRQALLRAQKYESVTIGGLVQFFHLLAHSSPEMDTATKLSINASLKNLVFFTHQNLLIVIQILLNRMIPASAQQSSTSVSRDKASISKTSGNYWASQL